MGQWVLVHDGQVYNSIVADAETMVDLGNLGAWPRDDKAIDVTGTTPAPGIGWSYDPDLDPSLRPPVPGEGWTWDAITGAWAPPPATEAETANPVD